MRRILVPAMFVGQEDAVLEIESPDGESAVMSLRHGGVVVARGGEFRRPEMGRGASCTWWDAPAGEVAGTFGGFLAYALESSEDGAREAWEVLTDDAGDWADPLALAEDGWDGHGNAPELVEIVAPFSEVCMSMRVAGSRMLAAPLPRGMAQLYDLDGRRFSAPVTRGEAGLRYEDAPSSARRENPS
jgi:hypothetical protein